MITDNEIVKASGEISCNKIKAIYPHITVSGDVGKPYYNIDWYDIEKQTMYRGYSSYKLSLVRKWLQENFEIVDNDIDNLINRQKSEIERLSDRNHKCIYLSDEETTEYCVDGPCPKFKTESQIKAEAVKEFAEKLKADLNNVARVKVDDYDYFCVGLGFIDNLVKEMVGEG